jgi:hypothetical protein
VNLSPKRCVLTSPSSVFKYVYDLTCTPATAHNAKLHACIQTLCTSIARTSEFACGLKQPTRDPLITVIRMLSALLTSPLISAHFVHSLRTRRLNSSPTWQKARGAKTCVCLHLMLFTSRARCLLHVLLRAHPPSRRIAEPIKRCWPRGRESLKPEGTCRTGITRGLLIATCLKITVYS